MKKENEFKNFERTLRSVLTVSHAEIKAKLEAEKEAKKRKKVKKSSASDREANVPS